MPKVNDLRWEYECSDKLMDSILGEMRRKRITKTSMAEELEMTKQGFGYALDNMTFNTKQLVKIFSVLGWDEEDIGKRMVRQR